MRHIVRGESCRGLLTSAAAAGFAIAMMLIAGRAPAAERLVSQEAAKRLGLVRAWFTQVRLDPARNKVERAVLNGDRLTVLTTAGIVQELDAITGRTYWTAPFGNENYPSLGPAGNDNYIAIVNGSTLYVLSRKDGKPTMLRPVGGAPGAGPALAENYVFVPLVSGRVEAFSLGEQKRTPWYYQSFGKAMVAPLVTPGSIVWTTDAGFLYVGNSNKLGMRYRLETGSDIAAPPSYLRPYVFVCSLSGDVFAMHEETGSQRWKYSTGFPILRAAAGVGDRVFVTSGEPALHCINATSGIGLWEAPNIVQFATVTKDRVYGVNDIGAFVVMNAANGTTLSRVMSAHRIHALVNDQTDWIYLISEDGIVECLHEVGSTAPVYHNPKPVEPKETPDEKAKAPVAKPAEKPKPAAKTSEEQPAKEAMPEEEKAAPKNDAADEGNPFGTG
jgi:outer membrane protein assembly factor BamB